MWHYSLYLLPNFLVGILSGGLAVLAWNHRAERTARPFVALMLALAVWSIAYGIELGYSSVHHLVFWDSVAFLGSVTVPAAFFMVALEYAGLNDQLPSWAPLTLAVEPLLTLAFVWGYPATSAIWRSVSVQRVGPLTLPVWEFGTWYWVNYVYSFLLIGAGLVVIGSVFVRGSRIYRRQATLLIGGTVFPLGANLFYNLVPGTSPFHEIDLTTFAMAVTGLLFGLALFRFKMLDLAPVARGMLLSEVGDGFVVVDETGAVVEGNDVGRAAASLDPDARLAGSTPAALESLDGRVVTGTIDGSVRSFELRIEAVTDFRSERVGTLVVFRDITKLSVVRRQEQRLAVMNRVLRHNIRNQMTVIGGYGDLLAESLDGEDAEKAATIVERAGKLAAIGEKARHISASASTGDARTTVPVGHVVESVVADAIVDYPDAAISWAGDDARAVIGESELETALAYLVENAIEHNDSAEPRVDVTITAGRGTVDVAVVDDGPGIPAVEREVIEAGEETPLAHGSGLGLWVVYWLVSQWDGRLTFDENDPRGSVVTITLPTAEAGTITKT